MTHHNTQTMTIGQLAKQTGVGIETIRFYERKGLLPCPNRKSSGYRQFGDEALVRMQFIRRAQSVGFTLREIEALLRLRDNPAATREEVRTQVAAKIDDLDAKMREMRRMRKELQELLASCHGDGSADDCPIIDQLSETTTAKDCHHGH